MLGEERANFIRRLRAVGDSLCRLRTIIEAGASCRQVLCQLHMAQAELQAVKTQMLNCQINTSKSIIQSNPLADQRLAELQRLLDLYTMLIQST